MYDVLTTMPGTEGIMYRHLLSILAHVVVTKCHRLGDLSKNHFLLIVLETEESKMRVPADLMSGEGPLLGLQTAVFSWYPHMAESRERAGLLSLLRRVLIHSQWLHPQDLITPLDSPSPTGESGEDPVHSPVITAVSY